MENLDTLYVIYHSEEWKALTLCTGNYATGKYGWITWEVKEVGDIKVAKMIWTRI